ncbi:uncharacterized protein JN550_000555 [Neoarthrinium moseri]|uniref:uncharacterized protein n=1 Tax=Neoarthrinium moseri TaxID=1658444 RepID=UPI001FDC58DD|nr:uncharacterized protein JN550_000555 [Neoarthrinium moseri]KAI1878373.1 hypothetical protein JN550_000555 [Neoarthrinium moseri]
MEPAAHPTDSNRLLITGVTGYIGFRTLLDALGRGYRVRSVVRQDRNIEELKSKRPEIAGSHKQGQLDFAVIPDFYDGAAWDKALDGITAIIHLASPLAKACDDYDVGVIDPAISMVKTVLEAAAQKPAIKRVVITSSCVTLIPYEWNFNPDSERLYTTSDGNWNPTRPFKSAMEAYWASKGLARFATRKFVEEKKPHFDFVNLLPGVVIGPDERIPSNGKVDSLLEGTRAAVIAPVQDGSTNSAFPYVGVPVHVADVARAHVDAVDTLRIPGNSEYILSSDTPEGVVWDRDITEIAKKFFSKEVDDETLPLKGSLQSIKWRLDGQTTENVFGWRFRSFEDTMRELIAQYLQLRNNN